jgi:hypothetical protein
MLPHPPTSGKALGAARDTSPLPDARRRRPGLRGNGRLHAFAVDPGRNAIQAQPHLCNRSGCWLMHAIALERAELSLRKVQNRKPVPAAPTLPGAARKACPSQRSSAASNATTASAETCRSAWLARCSVRFVSIQVGPKTRPFRHGWVSGDWLPDWLLTVGHNSENSFLSCAPIRIRTCGLLLRRSSAAVLQPASTQVGSRISLSASDRC